MSDASDANRALVDRFTSDWLIGHSVEALREVCHPDIAWHWGVLGDGRGVETLRAMEDGARAAFPDLDVLGEWTVADDRYVVRRSVVSGTHRGTWLGVEATNRHLTWTCMEAYRIADGRIAEQWLNEDWAEVLRQMGALPGV